MAENWEREAAARVSGDYGRRSFDDQRTSSRLPHLSPRARGSFEMTHNPAHRGSFVMEHVSHLPRSSGRFSGYSLDAQQLPGARVNNQLRTSLRPDGARHFNAQDPTSGVDPELLHDETRFVVDFWQGKVAGPGYAARKSFRQSVFNQPLPVPPPLEETIQAFQKENGIEDLSKEEQDKVDNFDLWLQKQADLRRNELPAFNPNEILLVLCGIVDMYYVYDIRFSYYERKRLNDIHDSLCKGNILNPPEGLKPVGLKKPKLRYSISSLFGYPPTLEDHFQEKVELRVLLEDKVIAVMITHLISTYEKSQRLVVDGCVELFDSSTRRFVKYQKPIDLEHVFYSENLDLDRTSYDGYTAAFCATATCSHQAKESRNIEKEGTCGKYTVLKYLDLNQTLGVLVMRNAKFIKPSDGKLDKKKRFFIFIFFCLIFGFAALFFWLITTYSSTQFHVNYKCDTVFNGLVLQPYGVILANILFFKIFERGINKTIDLVSYFHYSSHHEEDTEALKQSVEQGDKEMEEGMRKRSSKSGKSPPVAPPPSGKSDVKGKTKTKNLFAMHQYVSAWKQDSHYLESDFAFQTPFIFLYIQLLYGFVSIIMACVTVSKITTNDWDRYTSFFGIIANSCVPMTFFQAGKMAFMENRGEQMEKLPVRIEVVEGVFFLFLFTPMLTHLLPAAILYIWVVIFVFVSLAALTMVLACFVGASKVVEFVGALCRFTKKDGVTPTEDIQPDVDNRIMEYLGEFYTELVLRFMVVFFVQTLYNYACAVYQFPIPMTPQQYLWVIVRDYQLRTQTYCFFQKSFNSGAAGIVLFTSFI